MTGRKKMREEFGMGEKDPFFSKKEKSEKTEARMKSSRRN